MRRKSSLLLAKKNQTEPQWDSRTIVDENGKNIPATAALIGLHLCRDVMNVELWPMSP